MRNYERRAAAGLNKMTATELIEAVERAGARLVIEGGAARVRGAKLEEALLAELRANKAAVVEEIERRMREDRDRYGKVPPADAPMVALDAPLSEARRELVMGHVWRQGRPLHAWVQARAQRYLEQGLPATDCDALACVDVLAWQRCTGPRTAVQWLADLPTDEELAVKPPPAKETKTTTEEPA